MGGSIFIAMLASVFLWWFSTGAILLVVRLLENHSLLTRLKICIFSLPILAFGLWGIWQTSSNLTIVGSYSAFISAILVWGWIELTFLTGVVTGPNKSQCPKNIPLFEKFIRAWGTLAYHEVSLLLALGLVISLAYGQENHFGIWTFTVLYFARIFAKLNLFLGVPHVNAEFIPEALSHLKSYFKISKLNWFFSISVTILTLTTVCWVERLFTVQNSYEIIGFSLLFTISLMALLEHWFMVLPIPDARLWRWMLPKTKTKQDYLSEDYNGF